MHESSKPADTPRKDQAFNPEHLELVRCGARAIKEWQQDHPEEPMNLQGAYLGEADLEGINLPHANLEDAFLCGANLRGANLLRANLRHANMQRVNLQDAQLQFVNAHGAILTGSNLRGALAWNANLRSAGLQNACLQGSNLCSADLQDASLHGSNLRGANLHGAKHLSLFMAEGYVLDGQDTSTWVIPPRPMIPQRIVEPETPRWFIWKQFRFPYSDPWSTVRRSYTGVMTAFHLMLGTVALGPYALRAVLAEAHLEKHGMPRFMIALGWGREDAWFLVSTGIAIVAYNLLRIVATWWLSQLREEELRSRHAPAIRQYWPWWLAHKWFLRWAALSALALGLIRTAWWLCESV